MAVRMIDVPQSFVTRELGAFPDIRFPAAAEHRRDGRTTPRLSLRVLPPKSHDDLTQMLGTMDRCRSLLHSEGRFSVGLGQPWQRSPR